MKRSRLFSSLIALLVLASCGGTPSTTSSSGGNSSSSQNGGTVGSSEDISTDDTSTGGTSVHEHQWKELEKVEATCTEGGYTSYYCECGISRIEDVTEPLGHEYVTERKEADCTNDGYIHSICSRCGSDDYETIRATGHEYEETIVDPTCYDDGYTIFSCKNCSHEYTGNLTDALGHDMIEVASAIDPTCTEKGHTAKYQCSRCDYSDNGKSIEALGHDYVLGDYTIDREPTCTESGEKSIHCRRCNLALQTATIAATGHNYENWVCTNCHEAQPETTELSFTLNSDGVSYSVSDYGQAEVKDVIVPSTHEGLPVTGITSLHATTIRSIKIPDSVTSIARHAFSLCFALEKLEIGSGLSSIGSDIFYLGTENKHSIIALKTITVSEDNETFYSENNCLIERATKTLYYGTNESVIPSDVTSIRSYAFAGCQSLSSITLGSSITEIGDNAFYNCIGLTGTLTIPEGLITIGSMAFMNCDGLTRLDISDTVTTIKYGAFYSAEALEIVTIGKGVTSIGQQAFGYNTALTVLTVDPNNTVYRDYSNCILLKEESTLYLATNGFTTFPSGITKIGNYAFGEVSTITSITIPSSVTTIGQYAFRYCPNLQSVAFEGGTTEIGSYAFEHCTSLTSIAIPDSVTTLGNNLFESCTSLTSVTLSSNLKTIPGKCFIQCTALTSIVLPEGITTISYCAFENCRSLSSVSLPSTLTRIEYYTFNYCYSLTSAIFANTEGWSVGSTALSSEDLSDPSIAATYLRSTYPSWTWRCTTVA